MFRSELAKYAIVTYLCLWIGSIVFPAINGTLPFFLGMLACTGTLAYVYIKAWRQHRDTVSGLLAIAFTLLTLKPLYILGQALIRVLQRG